MFVEDDQFGIYVAQLTDLRSVSLEDWTQARDDALLLRNKGVFPAIDESAESGQWFAMQFALVLTAISLRRIDPAKWEEILTKARVEETRLMGDQTPRHPRQEGVMAIGSQRKDR
jgi:hypothetical protein